MIYNNIVIEQGRQQERLKNMEVVGMIIKLIVVVKVILEALRYIKKRVDADQDNNPKRK